VGVAVGKFNPPHVGHLHLIESGSLAVDHLYVLVCDRGDQTLPADSRAAWLRDAVPSNVTVLVTPDDLPEENEPWARRALDVLPERPTLAVTSEHWGPGWAAAMDAEHLMVDIVRKQYPISGDALRAGLASGFHHLVPAARAALARRVVLIGAESTGKTTLAQGLAESLRTVWVPEHGRWYWEGRRFLSDQSWTTDEFRPIAQAQRDLEDALARLAVGGVLIADTDALVTAVWHERYTGSTDPWLESFAEHHRPDLYMLCDTDIPWAQDGTRESRAERDWMQREITARAEASTVPVVLLSGTPEERLASALKALEPVRQFEELI